MAMMKAGIAGATVGALALATVMYVAPIAAQAPGAPPPSDTQGAGGAGPRGPDGPGMRGRGRGMTGPGMTGGRGLDLDDPDITGPRGGLAMCQERLARFAQWRMQRVERLVRPTDEQRAAFEEFKTATGKAADILSAACPSEQPLTPTAQLAAAEKRIEARLEAIRTVRPALEAFYKQLSDEQKIRWSAASQPGGNWRGRGGERRGDDRWGDHLRGYGGMPGRGEGGERWGGWRGPGGERWSHDGWRGQEDGRWGGRWNDRDDRQRGPGGWRDMERRGENLGRDRGGWQPHRWMDRWRDRSSRDEHNQAGDPDEGMPRILLK